MNLIRKTQMSAYTLSHIPRPENLGSQSMDIRVLPIFDFFNI